MKKRLLGIQFESQIGSLETNINKMENLLTKNIEKYPSDFIFLPEVWTCGWDCESFPSCAEHIENSNSINMLKCFAKKYNVNIIGGSFIKKCSDNTLSNCCPVINRDGDLIATYEKNHLFSYYGCNEGNYIKAGKNPVLVEIEGVKIGLSICYDIRFPELYRAYRKANADILVNMAAWGKNKKIAWDSMTTSRAVENQSYFVALTQTGKIKDGENLGHSMIIDYQGNILDEINILEDGIYATIDLDEMYSFREKCTILNDIKDSYEVIIK